MPKDERELLTRGKHFIIPDIMEEARMFEWAGINFGEEETYKLTKSIKVCFYCLFSVFLILINSYRDWQ